MSIMTGITTNIYKLTRADRAMITITRLATTRVRARAVRSRAEGFYLYRVKTVLLAGILNRTSLYRIKHRHYMSTVALHCIVQATATVTGSDAMRLDRRGFF
jgi:CRISPR/Cas system-associated endoribonuclease Cas2